MLKAQRILLNLLSLTFLVLAVLLIIQNLAIVTPVQFLTFSEPALPLGAVLIANSVLVAAAFGLKACQLLLVAGQQKNRSNRELERKDVSREEAEAKAKVLENKIQTLEKALSEALKSKTT